jgi:hypothetical protein
VKQQPTSVTIAVCGMGVECEYCEENYYLGDFLVYPALVRKGAALTQTNVHLEVIPVDKAGFAKNSAFQGRIDQWFDKNEGCEPNLITVDGLGKCFIHMEVFAR